MIILNGEFLCNRDLRRLVNKYRTYGNTDYTSVQTVVAIIRDGSYEITVKSGCRGEQRDMSFVTNTSLLCPGLFFFPEPNPLSMGLTKNGCMPVHERITMRYT